MTKQRPSLVFLSTIILLIATAASVRGQKSQQQQQEARACSDPAIMLPVLRKRIVSAVRGAFVADAASMGTHWIYDPSEMAEQVPSVDEPEFKNPPTPKYYSGEEFPGHYGPGMLSPYGEQLLFVAEHVAGAAEGKVEGPAMSEAMVEWANTFGGRPDHALNTFLENMKKEDGSGKWPNCGADDNQAHCFLKAVIVTCLYAGKPDLMSKVEDAIRVHQNNDMAVAFGKASAHFLESVLLHGSTLEEALASTETYAASDASLGDVKTALERAKAGGADGDSSDLNGFLKILSNEILKDKPDSPMADLVARSCLLPGAFTAVAFLIRAAIKKQATADAKNDDGTLYAWALRENILAAGDTCSRSILGGAIFAAASSPPPQNWIDRVDAETMSKVNAVAEKIASLRVQE